MRGLRHVEPLDRRCARTGNRLARRSHRPTMPYSYRTLNANYVNAYTFPGGAMGLTRTLGEAWAVDGIRVNGIAPGLVATKMTKVTTDNPKRLEASLQGIPLGRLGTPADMAGVALFLASPLSAYVVGQTIPVDGGLIL